MTYNNDNNYETFIPYDQTKEYIFVEFISLEKDQEGFSNIMVIKYKNKEYRLYWDEYHSYYRGTIDVNNKKLEGFIV